MSAFTDHVRQCALCRAEKECSEAERLVEAMDAALIFNAVAKEPSDSQIRYEKQKAMAAGAGK